MADEPEQAALTGRQADELTGAGATKAGCKMHNGSDTRTPSGKASDS